MKWIGQHIWDFISRFRNIVYLEYLFPSPSTTILVVDPDGKVGTNSGAVIGGVNSVAVGPAAVSTGVVTTITPNVGSVIVIPNAYAGTTNVGHVPAGGSASTWLRGDGTWVTPPGTGVTTFTNANGTFISAGTVNTGATGAVTVGTIDLSATGLVFPDTTKFLRGDNTWAVPTYSAGTVTGSGTATRVAFWDSASSIGSDADLYWDNVNKRVGIGTIVPDEKLHIFHATVPVVKIEGGPAPSSAYLNFETNAVDRWNIGVPAGKTRLNFNNSVSDLVTILTTGEVGIGTTAPDEELHVEGSIKMVDGNEGVGKVLTSDVNGVGAWAVPTSTFTFDVEGSSGTTEPISSGDTLIIAQGTGITSVSSNPDTVTITLADTVVTPGSYTYSSITVDQQGRLTAASSGAAPGTMSSFDISDGVTVETIANGNTLTFTAGSGITAVVSAVDTLTITNTYVISGTINQIPKFTAATAIGDSIMKEGGVAGQIIIDGGVTTPRLTFDDSGVTQLEILGGSTYTQFTSVSSWGYLFKTSTSANAIAIDNTSAFVAIGPTAGGGVVSQCHVEGVSSSSSVPLQRIVSTGTISNLQFFNATTSTNAATDGMYIGANGLYGYIINRETASLYLGSAGSVGVTIDATNDVGINTTTPDEKLHVVGNIKMVDGNQGVGKVLTSDVNGVGAWATIPAAIQESTQSGGSGKISSWPAMTYVIPKKNGGTFLNVSSLNISFNNSVTIDQIMACSGGEIYCLNVALVCTDIVLEECGEEGTIQIGVIKDSLSDGQTQFNYTFIHLLDMPLPAIPNTMSKQCIEVTYDIDECDAWTFAAYLNCDNEEFTLDNVYIWCTLNKRSF